MSDLRGKLPDGEGGGAGKVDIWRRKDGERLREMQLSIAASSSVFPGFRFSPTDDELISYYLKKKIEGCDNCVDIIPEVDFCRHEPWDLPAISIIRSDNEWFFFSSRGRKYPNGSQSRRATQSGYWKATGKERNVKSGSITIGTKRTLVFHTGRAPKGERTEWIMHEYCMNETTQETLVICRLRRNGDFRLNESSRGYCDHRNLSARDNSNSGTSGFANTQTGVFDGAEAMKSCSKESTGSYRSHSVEQINDSESESYRKLIHNSQHGSSSQHKEHDEDDCFADILNDDIIKLDEDSSSLSSHALPLQGTAIRRIKLRQAKVPATLLENPSFGSQTTSSRCVIRHRRSMYLVLMIFLVLLLMLFVAWQAYCLKQFLVEVPMRKR